MVTNTTVLVVKNPTGKGAIHLNIAIIDLNQCEDNGYHHPDPNFKVSRLSGNGPTPEQELLTETGLTQTQPIITQPLDKVTDAIRMELKSHFELPGGPQIESLNKLTAARNRRGADMLFYQTYVLATRAFIKERENAPYKDMLITRVQICD